MNRRIHLLRLIFAAFFITATFSCDVREKKAAGTPVDLITGNGQRTWQRKDGKGRKINITFGKNGFYMLHLYSVRMQFIGDYTISGNTIRIIDKYCGKALPGIYRFEAKKDELRFEIIDDRFCQRRKILPDDVWIPDTADIPGRNAQVLEFYKE